MKLSACFCLRARTRRIRRSQQGYLLLVILLMLALLMIALVAVAPRIAQQIRRDREEETIQRGTQYVRAIRLFYRKFGRYPTSMDELLSTNRIRFLRQEYKDPLSADGKWRIIHLGEAKVTPTGFGSQTATATGSNQPNTPTGAFGSSGPAGAGPGGMAGSQPGAGPGGSGQAGSNTSGSGSGGASGPSGPGSSSSGSSGTTFGGGAIVGVAPLNNDFSIKELNGKNHYNEWEFVYDPRFDVSNRQGVLPGGVPAGTPGTPQPGPAVQPSPSPGPTVPPPMNPR